MNCFDDADTAILNFRDQELMAGQEGWLQARYYCDEGESLRGALTFNSVFEISRFEIPSAAEKCARKVLRARYRALYPEVVRRLSLAELLPRPFFTLSNGEMRRALFARVILRLPKRLVLKDPMAGLDPQKRAEFRAVIAWLREQGFDVTVETRYADEMVPGAGCPVPGAKGPVTGVHESPSRGRGSAPHPVIEINHLTLGFGKRELFHDFTWRVARGEKWVVKGPNGSGKTTLMALISGDSPLAYANDVKVFGIPRKPGYPLAATRSRLAVVSPEMQTYLHESPQNLLEMAFSSHPDLLILDEPCLNLDADEAEALLEKVTLYLKKHPRVTCVCIAHREDHIPKGFELTLDLGA